MMGERTSVPRWDTTPPEPDPSGRAYTIMTFGTDGRSAAQGLTWITGLASARPWWAYHGRRADAEAVDLLRDHMATATVGWRLMLAGPEIDVLTVRAAALGAGAVPAEIREYVTATADRRVYCPHCRTPTVTARPVGGTVRCDGCRRTLLIHDHVSPRMAAYLGRLADQPDQPDQPAQVDRPPEAAC